MAWVSFARISLAGVGLCLLVDSSLAATLISHERSIRLSQQWERNGYTCALQALDPCEVNLAADSTLQEDAAEGKQPFAGSLDAVIGQVTQTSSLAPDQLSASGTLSLAAIEDFVCLFDDAGCPPQFVFVSDFYWGTARNAIDVVFGVTAPGQVDLMGTIDATSGCCGLIYVYPDLRVSVWLGPIDGPPTYQVHHDLGDQIGSLPLQLTESIPVMPGTYRLTFVVDAGVDWFWFASDEFTPVNVDVTYDLEAALPSAPEVPTLSPAARAVLVAACSLASMWSIRRSSHGIRRAARAS